MHVQNNLSGKYCLSSLRLKLYCCIREHKAIPAIRPGTNKGLETRNQALTRGLWYHVQRPKVQKSSSKGACQVVLVVKNLPAIQELRGRELSPWVGTIPWRREWAPAPVFWPGESHGQRTLLGYRPWGHKELDTPEATQHAAE